MGINIDKKLNRVHLFTQKTSYVIEVFEGELLHSYWGKKIILPHYTPLVPIEEVNSFSPNPNKLNKTYSLDILPREFPDYGRSDFRSPAYQFILEDGTNITKFIVKGIKKEQGKRPIPDLPACYQENNGEFETLIITLEDYKSKLQMKLYYCVSEKYEVITRYCEVINTGNSKIYLDRLLSMNVDFYNDNNFDLLHFYGSWARERHINRIDIGHSTHTIESKRGASSHQQNPLILLARKDCNEQKGEVYGMNLVYSGSFKGTIEVNPYNSTRVQIGINDFGFKWCLKANEAFFAPEVVMVYSNEGFNGMSNIYHRLYRERLIRGAYRDKPRPILINNWEATYFDFDEEKLECIGKAASEVGIELFVLDDGWFGKRNSDKTSLGDWYVNKQKLPTGLKGVANKLKNMGLLFGLWFEPEMISPDSELYMKHADWCIHVNGLTRSEGRNQLVLDLSNIQVQDYLIKIISDILESNPINYVKWDMNRHVTEVGSGTLPPNQQGEVMHRYILGLYRVMEELTSQFKDILFESCSGGGGRFDPGMLYYMPQVWTSDDTDAYERMFIQYGTSFAYPQISMGAHVSCVPNHQVGRSTPLQTRTQMAMTGNLGYELDLSSLSTEEIEIIKEHIKFYKKERKNLQFGKYYRLINPYENGMSSVLIETPQKDKYYLFIFFGVNKPNQNKMRIQLVYLKEGKYIIESVDFNENNHSKHIYDSSFLNLFGYECPLQNEDFESHLIVFTRV